ncbi:MAG: M28 family peptidase [Bacteroidales bacterium]|nr:M28 family peptidase [Bacteroidales bacterium]
MRAIRFLFLACLLLLPFCRVQAQAAPGELALRLRRDVSFLSSPLLGGRQSGSRGAQEAAAYILRAFRAAGLSTSVQTYGQDGKVGHNLVGIWRGNPKRSEYIAVTAYYDGLGTLDGRMFPGADSNASGVSALLALAARLAGSGNNYVFIALDGHNDALAGAAYCARCPLGKISLLVNLDTMGTTLSPPYTRKDYLIVLGADAGNIASLRKANGPGGLRLYFDYYGSDSFTNLFYRKLGDQAPFLRSHVPALMFTSGITPHTNKVTDMAGTLDYPVFARRVALIGDWLESRQG